MNLSTRHSSLHKVMLFSPNLKIYIQLVIIYSKEKAYRS